MTTYEPVLELIGMPWPAFCAYLEEQFTEEMTWLNYGSAWLADHRFPMRCWALADPIDRAMCCSFLNLRPATPEANLRKTCLFDRHALKEYKTHWWRTYGPGQQPMLLHCPEAPAVCEQPF